MKQENDDAERDQAASEDDPRVKELESRCAELESRWLRAQADYQNSRRRAQQELDSALLHNLQPLLGELLLVLDYLDLALSTPIKSPDAKALAQGVEMTRTKLLQALALADVKTIPTEGAFDPSLHEAVQSRPTRDHAPGTILETVRPGYTFQGRILRHAPVVVAAAPQKTGTESETEKASS
jgi:molecular chaperone GrpE